MLSVDDPMGLSLLFHLNSEPWLNDEAYENAGGQAAVSVLDASTVVVPLPPPEASELASLWARRRSCRTFAARTMPLANAAARAAAAQGVVEVSRNDDGHSLIRRSAPSAGGLYPLDVYVFTTRVADLPDGLYRYNPVAHSLEERARGDVHAWLARLTYAGSFIANANLVFAVSATFARCQKKYGPRGYRYILLESGHAVQNVCLRAVELGLETLCLGGFVDSLVNEALGLTSTEAGVVYMVAAGYDASRPDTVA